MEVAKTTGGGIALRGVGGALGVGKLLVKAPGIGRSSLLFGRRFKDASGKWVGKSGALNKGPIRLGWGWNGSKDVFCGAIGNPTKNPIVEWLRHFDF